MSAFSDVNLAVKSIKLGAQAFLTKPLDISQLEIEIQNALLFAENKINNNDNNTTPLINNNDNNTTPLINNNTTTTNNNTTIVVIEDDSLVNKIIVQFLKTKFENIESFLDANNAVEKIQQINPNLILLDVCLGEFNGIDILEQLRANG